jgi:hypothetical protein
MPVLPRPDRLSLHDAIGYVAERCECELIKAGKAVLAALGGEALVASANVLVRGRHYMPGIYDASDSAWPPRRVDAGIQPVPSKLWAGYPWPWFERRAVLPRGNPQYREHRADGRDIGPVYDNPTIATADIDRWLDGDARRRSTGTGRKGPRGPQPGTLDRYGEADRALFPEIERIQRECNASVTAAALMLAEGKIDGKEVPGAGAPLSKAKRLGSLYRRERGAGRSKPSETR